MISFLRRHLLLTLASAYLATLIGLHAHGTFPRPGLYDLSRLIGSSQVTVEGRVLEEPLLRWGQTRFMVEGCAVPLDAFTGRVEITLPFPVSDLAPGEIVQVRGWLRSPRVPRQGKSFDEAAYLGSRGCYALLKVWGMASFQRLRPPQAGWSRAAYTFQQRFLRFWFLHLPYEHAALLAGITMGRKGDLPMPIKAACIRAGVYHILVVSGQNVALLIALGIGCLRLCGIPRRWALWVSAPLILFYCCVVGAEAPVVRASVMAIILLATAALGRDIPPFYALTLAALAILLREPEALFGASFQLSFGATASLIAIAPHLRGRWLPHSPAVRWLMQAQCLALAVHLGTWPLLLQAFHQLSIVGLIANWTVFPCAGLVMIVGLTVGTAGVFWPNLWPSQTFWVMEKILTGMLWGIEKLSSWHWSAIPLPAPSWPICGVYYIGLFCILWRIKKESTLSSKWPSAAQSIRKLPSFITRIKTARSPNGGS